MQKLLIVEDDQAVRTSMVTCLEMEGYDVEAVSSTREALDRLEKETYPIVISDIYLDERTGLDVMRTARRQNPDCAVILMTGRGSMETVMAATAGGVFEYLAKPFEMSQMVDTIRRAEKSLADHQDDEAASIDDLPETEMIGSSPRMIEIYKTLSKVAPTDATVLIEGETGTGKELIARMIHTTASARSSRSFRSIAARLRPRFWKASCSERSRAPTLEPIGIAWEYSKPPTMGRCFWTKSGISTWDFS